MPDWLTALRPWWPDLGAFWQMGKHGFYVWMSFGLCALGLALEWLALARRASRLRRRQRLAAATAHNPATGGSAHDVPTHP